MRALNFILFKLEQAYGWSSGSWDTPYGSSESTVKFSFFLNLNFSEQSLKTPWSQCMRSIKYNPIQPAQVVCQNNMSDKEDAPYVDSYWHVMRIQQSR